MSSLHCDCPSKFLTVGVETQLPFPPYFFWKSSQTFFQKTLRFSAHTLLLTEDLRFVCALTGSQIILTQTLHRHGGFALASKLTDVWPKGVCATVVLLLNLCFFSGGIAKRQTLPAPAWGGSCLPLCDSLGVFSAQEPLIKGRVPHHVVVHGFTFAQKLLKVSRRKDGPVAKG